VRPTLFIIRSIVIREYHSLVSGFGSCGHSNFSCATSRNFWNSAEDSFVSEALAQSFLERLGAIFCSAKGYTTKELRREGLLYQLRKEFDAIFHRPVLNTKTKR